MLQVVHEQHRAFSLTAFKEKVAQQIVTDADGLIQLVRRD
jgi:hypothetical protein